MNPYQSPETEGELKEPIEQPLPEVSLVQILPFVYAMSMAVLLLFEIWFITKNDWWHL